MAQNLYHAAIVDHHHHPIGKDRVFTFSHHAEGENPSCGDELTLYLQLEHQHIEQIGFSCDACAICTASASLLCQQLSGKHLEQATAMALNLDQHLRNNQGDIDPSLAALSAVTQYPSRLNCALLPWSTLTQILQEVQAQ